MEAILCKANRALAILIHKVKHVGASTSGGLTLDEAWDTLARLTLQDWQRDLNSIPDNSNTGGRLKFYRILKASPSVEQYNEAGISLNKRWVITQLRTGCHPLEVELGRYRSPKTSLADRLCQLCKSGIGDESHLLLDCSVLSEQTAQLQYMMTRKVEAVIELSIGWRKCAGSYRYVDQTRMLAN